jgi:hypothetical protein
MLKEATGRAVWHPQTQQEREAVLQELQEVLASPQFSHSKRYPALLDFIVKHTLDGHADHLKERTLGVEVFDRPPTYDTNSDTVVRYTAGEVRRRLAHYYHEGGRNHDVRITLPVGSYVPEFFHGPFEHEDLDEKSHPPSAQLLDPYLDPNLITGPLNPEHLPAELTPSELAMHLAKPESIARPRSSRLGIFSPTATTTLLLTLFVLAIVVAAIFAEFKPKPPASVHAQTPVEDFWAPVLHDQRSVLICVGGSVFSNNHYSGVNTATKDTDYPFVSMQSATAIAQLSGLLDREGSAPQLQFANSTTLTEIRNHPVIFLGAYNNQWTMRLVQQLRYHFPPSDPESIIDQRQPGIKWLRDQSLPYSSADDYALVARFRDSTTDDWVVVLAGVGRNGSEAAAQFVTSPHYMQQLRDQLKSDFSNKNIEVVLKVNVIDAKTGAPSILAIYSW